MGESMRESRTYICFSLGLIYCLFNTKVAELLSTAERDPLGCFVLCRWMVDGSPCAWSSPALTLSHVGGENTSQRVARIYDQKPKTNAQAQRLRALYPAVTSSYKENEGIRAYFL